MKIELVVDGKAHIPVSFEMLEAIVDRFPVNAQNIAQLEILSEYPCSDVRVSLANTRNITQSMFSKLLASGDSRVIQALLENSDARSYFDSEALAVFAKQPSFARAIAQNIEGFNCDDALIVALATNEDPAVRKDLAGNYSAPKKAVRSLAKDSDPAVAQAAASTLG